MNNMAIHDKNGNFAASTTLKNEEAQRENFQNSNFSSSHKPWMGNSLVKHFILHELFFCARVPKILGLIFHNEIK